MSALLKRIPPEIKYTPVRNDALRDPNLTLEAKGLLAQLLSHRDGWEVSQRGLAKANNCGRQKIATAMALLVEHGYVRSDQTRSDEGLFASGVLWVTDDPTVVGLSDHGLPDRGQTDHKEEHPEENESEGTTSAPSFESFWNAYPVKKGKANAAKTWKRLGDARTAAIERLPFYLMDTTPGFVKHGSTYLNQRVWEDYDDYDQQPSPTPAPTEPERPAEPLVEPWTNVTADSFNEARQALELAKRLNNAIRNDNEGIPT